GLIAQPVNGRHLFPSLSPSLFFPLYKSSHKKRYDSDADSRLDTEKQAFHLSGKLPAQNPLQNGRRPNFVSGIHLFHYRASGVVRTAEFRILQKEKRNQRNQYHKRNQRKYRSLLHHSPSFKKPAARSSGFAYVSRAATISTVMIPSITASGICVGANTARN